VHAVVDAGPGQVPGATVLDVGVGRAAGGRGGGRYCRGRGDGLSPGGGSQ
jgi:hypothetical protein